ncbi:hypothetical protein PARPLA_01385 [Rhodobacteraceae bacterium THAF1]|uniref:hypothetical protein n=1 Tax=Palleronia sp. THAF1 TaxID=2587842 RepID=UPI000F3C042D|nr:hypothetical protein [Palleronia sp. THAF1]QFU09433.1 hypothetical protein FIU81_12175 [Palleronia sp. THAF1]VDC21919.1 hypothetical protein PARPLA_01385 [Rhodobacteraceae bacterium THAF1]
MTLLEQVADQLAQETIAKIDAGAEEELVRRVAEAIANASQTMEEAYLTCIRIRRAESRAKAVLAGV